MIEIAKLGICPSGFRIGWCNVKYHKVILRCNICVYKEEKLYIKMPEVFFNKEKFAFAFWTTKKDSDDFQKEVLKQLKRSIGLDLKKGISLKREWLESQKLGDKNKKSI